MSRNIITFITDFGLADHYAAAMKGVALGICPRAQIVDISHDVAPFAIAEGAYLLAQAYAYFPKGTVHVAVVDPGVGSKRRAIVLEAAGQFFVGPDNGIFSMIMARGKYKVREIANDRYFHHPVSNTFHGRDIFSPVGAHLAAGVPAARMGKRIGDAAALDLSRPQVLHVDRFGNVVTSLREAKGPVKIGKTVVSKRATHYAEAEAGSLFLIEGSSGYLEISVNGASAAKRLGCKAGDRITV
jgi:S-adenosylmethionine hydrolase